MKARKDQLKVVVFTPQHRIMGQLHLIENSRLTDILNTESVSRDFLPITNAEILDLKTGKTTAASFLSVNKKHVEMVIEESNYNISDK